MLLRFEDEKVFRARSNSRSIRRTTLRLLSKLPNVTMRQTFHDELVTMGGKVDSSFMPCTSSSNDHSSDLTPVGEKQRSSPYDKSLSYYVRLSRDTLAALCESMLATGYSLSYIRNVLTVLRADYGSTFPLSRHELRAFIRSIVETKSAHFVNVHRQTDEVYSMSDKEYEALRTSCTQYIAAIADYQDTLHRKPTRRILICYLYLMMYYTGKRMSDVCILRREDLQRLLEERDLAIRIPKTDRIGRISMSYVEDPPAFEAFLRCFIRILDSRHDFAQLIPFDQFAIRRALNRTFKVVYESVLGKRKPNGLAFHSLRRRKAALFFKRGENLETIRECLDHTNSKVTNEYINKFLLRSTADGGSGMAQSGVTACIRVAAAARISVTATEG